MGDGGVAVHCYVHAEARAALVARGADADEVSPAWILNHYRWVVWKLAAEERRLPRLYPPGSRLAWPVVVNQLLYRYEREWNVRLRSRVVGRACLLSLRRLCAPLPLVVLCGGVFPSHCAVWVCFSYFHVAAWQLGHRSALYRMFDSASSKCPFVVLVVTEVDAPAAEVEVSDGWYSIRATLDAPMAALAARGDVCVGMKLAVCAADVTGVESGHGLDPLDCPPSRGCGDLEWPRLVGSGRPHRGAGLGEAKAAPKLALTANACRPAK